MIDERTLATALLHLTQDECRELGEHFISLADSPRDAAWKAKWQRRLDELPKTSLAIELEAAQKRARAYEDEQMCEGWHPVQMRRKLEELGYKNGVAE